MLKKSDTTRDMFENFYLPFGGTLPANNRWLLLAKLVPWDKVEKYYAPFFCQNKKDGAPAKPARLAFGALIVQKRTGMSDREVVEFIKENPFVQLFLGLEKFTFDAPFTPSMMTHFRKRFTKKFICEVNQEIVLKQIKAKHKSEKKTVQEEAEKNCSHNGKEKATYNDITCNNQTREGQEPPANKGKLIMDTTCVPADVQYPTDVRLLDEARQKAEKILDLMYAPKFGEKPQYNRKRMRKKYLSVAKSKRPGQPLIREVVGLQLDCIKADLELIERLCAAGRLCCVPNRLCKYLPAIKKLYEQQEYMYKNNVRKVDDRIVSLNQPYVRPIVRGKARINVEFGAKISCSVVEGFVFLDRLSWDAYNESEDLIKQVENYRERFGFYPESVHADQIYRTSDNRAYCKARSIRISGAPLGKSYAKALEDITCNKEKEIRREDESVRQSIEGKFGQAKRKYGLDLVKTKLACTSETEIAMTFLVINLEKMLSKFIYLILRICLCFVLRFYNGVSLTGLIYWCRIVVRRSVGLEIIRLSLR